MSTASGMPMSATCTAPHSARPGISRCPGLRRKNVTVRLGLHDGPVAAPVVPSRPLGTSTAMTRIAASVHGLDDCCRGALERARQTRAEQRVDDEPGAFERGERQRLDPTGPAPGHGRGVALQGVARPEQRHARRRGRPQADAAPRRNHRRRCCRARKAPARGRLCRPSAAASTATARPAFSISVRLSTPAFTARWSARVISAVVSSSSPDDTQPSYCSILQPIAQKGAMAGQAPTF